MMKIKITKGNGWYEDKIGEVFEVYEVSDVGSSFSPEKGYTVDPIQSNVSLSYVSEFDCEVICEECNKPLSKDDEYHMKWGTCNSYCYGKMVGVY